MTTTNRAHEHEFEPQYGLPERLPSDERIVWQVSPDAWTLAKDAFHFRKLVVYFAVLCIAKVIPEVTDGAGLSEVLLSLKLLAPLALLGLASVWILALMTARTTVYTLTNKRLVMRLGVVLTVTFNLPLSKITGANLRKGTDGFGGICLSLPREDHIAWIHLWPSARPWCLANPEPMIRSVANVDVLADQLAAVWSAATGISAVPAQVRSVPSGSANHRLQAGLA